jgi:hypothetical protein
VTVYRCFAWDPRARESEPDGALWMPRPFQGEGRHDNPDLYGCLYLADRAQSAVVEQLARFRGQRLMPSLLKRRGLALALATLDIDARAELLDLDDPLVLSRERLKPSIVATRIRTTTQPQARSIFERYPRLAGLRWWSIYEAQWTNVTLFDRAARHLTVRSVRPLAVTDAAVGEAADFLGLRIVSA